MVLIADLCFLLFAFDIDDPLDVSPGLHHMIDALNRLSVSCEARKYVVFPLSVRSPDEVGAKDGRQFYELIFPNLLSDGFKIGVPSNSKYHIEYISTFRAVVGYIHDAGVLHCDLYPSNIMWRVTAHNGVLIKIIDWDVAHCLSEINFSTNVKFAIESHNTVRSSNFGIQHDNDYIDALEYAIQESSDDLSKGIFSTVKAELDTAFFGFFQRWIFLKKTST